MKPLAVDHDSTGGTMTEDTPSARQDRRDWQALPQRSRPGRPSSLLSIRTPISRGARTTLIVMSFAVPLAAWFIVSAAGVVEPTFLPSPAATWSAGVEMAKSGELFTDMWDTVQRILYGFGLAVLVSVPLGILMGTFSAANSLFGPLISAVRYLPAPAFIPLLIIWVGLDEWTKILLLFIGTVFFNTMMTADVVRSVPMPLINVSYTLGARRGEVLRKVIVPHSLPGIVDAARVNVAAAWNFVVVAELVVSTTGLGRRIVQAQRFLQTDRIFAILILIGVIGVLIDLLLRLLRNQVGRWTG
ncbi:NitT/TauT family transport system permease protein [Kibdelosporangium banguiense]|uniref:NitT/TauT family transport system permease protein n=1 Tax=Kibdelosporangium banguiense TaxID=1365924 RepID=A0ABS4T6E6_9PSEU|nr:ABC transporter permease [Kibdelosporangium banguiense]MBP2319995.1 NitT/TauT family transport system permease protein [Kibdelosporangium banguiense]